MAIKKKKYQTSDIQAFKDFTESLKNENRSIEKIKRTFTSANILTKNGNFTKNYKVLNSIFISSK